MIEKFLEKFLPQITERLNENEEVGKALIEALAVLDNYATINNVQFTDEQVNTMLGIVPEPAPEPNADIPAEIVEIVEKKKRGRKPKAATTAQPSTWSWRFKTEQEMKDEFGDSNWRKRWGGNNRDYLFGKSIPETPETIDFIDKVINKDLGIDVDTASLFGISNPNNSSATYFLFDKDNVTDKALPTAATPTWNWRFKTEEEFINEFGTDWAKEIGWNTSHMNYLLGEEITKTTESEEAIEELTARTYSKLLNTLLLGIDNGGDNTWRINTDMLTDKPLPKVILRRGQPLTQPTNTAWTWRFKTEQEFEDYYGRNWSNGNPSWNDNASSTYNMAFLFGQPITQNTSSQEKIKKLENGVDSVQVNVEEVFGIKNPNPKGKKIYQIGLYFLTTEPLPTAEAPAKSEPKKRGRKPKSALPEIDLGGLEDIGDIDIDAIDFDNLVI